MERSKQPDVFSPVKLLVERSRFAAEKIQENGKPTSNNLILLVEMKFIEKN